MKDYLDELIKIAPLDNREFNFISKFDISIPILRCIIKIIKRRETGLQLTEEIIMKLLDQDITTISEISKILGLNEEIVDEVIGRLSVKDFILVTAGNCVLLTKGKKALKELKQIRLENENISPVFINLITEEIYTDLYKNQSNKYVKKENILSSKIKIDLGYINKRFEEVKEIFDIQQESYGANNLSKVELYKIEDIEEDKIQYVNIKADIYKSRTGDEIEIVSHNNSDLIDIQNEILYQILNQNKFKYIFKNTPKYRIISNKELEANKNDNNDIYDIICKYNKLNDLDQEAIKEKFYKIYKNDRLLLDNEVSLMVEELTLSAKKVDIYVESLSEILFDEEYMISICKGIHKGLKVNLYYNKEKDIKRTLDNAKRKFPEVKEISIYSKEELFHEIILVFDDKYEIDTKKYDVKVIGEKYITKSISYIKNI